MLSQTKHTLGQARDGIRQMNQAVTQAWSSVEGINTLRGSREAASSGEALRELAEACESAAQSGRSIHHHVRQGIEDARTAVVKVSRLESPTRRDEVDRDMLVTRLEHLDERLGSALPLVEQSVVALAGIAEHARQSTPTQGRDASLATATLEHRLRASTGAGGVLRDELARAEQASDLARAQALTISHGVRVRMDAARERAPVPGGPGSAPGVGR
ncbi:hypothetical protein NF557_08015 [Ornithinimicrobium cryptoxanthini]|uniref:Methyl-accepting transducer domain-containing protein n=2 Tax=Ornithinimicrobium cryptoxanthini TaxID=2934161 RepID=A0ABY4YN94_9MICO|nr:hypothetical protein [Ornithinimicrobium cryptoxanthini]USQ77823.1 hypothetical protein NF557_08015 [Ornithinimicrobium cryptoxanthini]